jgi:uncharacterized membrane protein (UPF0127 family)
LRNRIAAAGLLALALLAPAGHSMGAGTSTLVFKTDTGEHRFNIEVATSDLERARGLMFRRSLPENDGMLFVYDPPQPVGMWMKNTFIPLDMVFIAPDRRVLRIEANTEPFSTTVISSEGTVAGVVELNGGEADKINLKPGDQVISPALSGKPSW